MPTTAPTAVSPNEIDDVMVESNAKPTGTVPKQVDTEVGESVVEDKAVGAFDNDFSSHFAGHIEGFQPVSYTHLTLPTILRV